MKGQQQTPVPSVTPREATPAEPTAAYANSDAIAAMAGTAPPADPDLLGLSGDGATWKGESHHDDRAPSGDRRVGNVVHDDHALTTEGYAHETGTTRTFDFGATWTDKESTSWGWGSTSWGTEQARTLDTTDATGTADAVRKALTEKADHIDARRAQLDATLAAFDASMAPWALSADERSYAEIDALGSSREALVHQRESLAAEAQTVRAGAKAVTVDNASATAREHGVDVPRAVDTTGHEKEASTTWDWNPFDEDGVESESSTTTHHAGDAKSTHTSSSSTKVAVGEGLSLTHTKGSSVTLEDGDESYERSDETSVTGGLVVGEDGEYGVKAGGSREVKDGDLTTTYGANGQLTTNGVSGDASAGLKQELGNGLSAGTKTSTTGNFTVVIEEASDGLYDLVVTLAAGASLALSGEAERGEKSTGKASASASVTGSVNGSMVFVHTLTEDDARLYLGKLDAADKGKASGDEPELQMLAKLAVLGSQAFEDDAGAAALVDASAAKNIGSNDSFRIALSAKGEVEGKASVAGSGMGVSVDGRASSGGSVTYGVKRVPGPDGRPRIEVTAGFSTDSAWKAGVGLHAGIAKTGGSLGGSQSRGYTATFLLDPDAETFELQYDRIMGASSESELRALEKHPEVLAARSKAVLTESSSAAEGHTASLGPLAGTFDATSRQSLVSTETAAGTSTRATGERDTNLTLGFGPASIGQQRTDSVVGTVDAAGRTDLRISQRQADTRFAPGLDEGTSLRDGLVQTPGATLQAALTETDAELQSLHLDDAQFSKLIARAHDASNWGRCTPSSPKAADAWRNLRVALANGADDPAARRQKVDALDAFVSRFGEHATGALDRAVWHWGETLQDSEAQAEDIATMTAFPESIATHQDEYYAIQTAMKELPQRSSALLQSDAAARRWCADLTGRIDTVYVAVEKATDFTEPRAKLEMMDALMKWADSLETARTGAPETPEGAVQQAMADVQRGEALMRGYKPEEARLFDKIRSAVVEADDGMLETLGKMVQHQWSGDLSRPAFASLDELYESWTRDILDLRDAYVRAGMTDGWMVSAGPGAPRHGGSEPDVDTYARLWALHWSRYSGTNLGEDQSDRASRYRSY